MTESRIKKLQLPVLAIIGVASFVFMIGLLCRILPPERIDVTGRITDGSGKPLRGAKICAVPIPVREPMSEEPREVCDRREPKAISDGNGMYRLKGLAGICGWKESSYIQPYHITAEAPGYMRQLINFQKPQRTKQSTITGVDFVLESETKIPEGE